MIKINSKFLTSLLTFSIVTTNLIGCTSNDIAYVINSESEKEIEGIIDYDALIKCKVINVYMFGENRVYIAIKYGNIGDGIYHNIFNYGLICYHDNEYNSENIKFLKECDLNDYLIYYDEVKATYSKEDIERIYEKIKENNLNETLESSKELIKEREYDTLF